MRALQDIRRATMTGSKTNGVAHCLKMRDPTFFIKNGADSILKETTRSVVRRYLGRVLEAELW